MRGIYTPLVVVLVFHVSNISSLLRNPQVGSIIVLTGFGAAGECSESRKDALLFPADIVLYALAIA